MISFDNSFSRIQLNFISYYCSVHFDLKTFAFLAKKRANPSAILSYEIRLAYSCSMDKTARIFSFCEFLASDCNWRKTGVWGGD